MLLSLEFTRKERDLCSRLHSPKLEFSLRPWRSLAIGHSKTPDHLQKVPLTPKYLQWSTYHCRVIWSSLQWGLSILVTFRPGHWHGWRTQSNSKLVLRSQPRAQAGIHIQVSDLFLAMANFCRTETAHSQRVHKASQQLWPLASILTSHLYRQLPHLYLQPRSHPVLPTHTFNCIFYVSTQMIS